MSNSPIKNITQKYITTKLLLILFFTLSVIDFLNIVNFSNLISLNSGFTVYGKEYWRLLLYPYVANNLPNLIFISTIGVYVFIKLENLVSKGSLFILFLFYSLMYGLTFTAATVQESISASGLDSFFLFSLFLLSFIKKDDRYYPLGKDNQFFLEYANSKSKVTSKLKINKLTYFHFTATILSLWLIKELSLFTFDINYNIIPSLTAMSFALVTSFLSHKKIFTAENEINHLDNFNSNYGLT
jgi:membrane associated rhomboid family serine protease